MGFAVRIVFTAVEFAGEIIGLQMGLNFAAFFNPMTASSDTAVSRFFGVSVAWLFIVIGGHLMLIAAVVQSFTAFPVSAEPFAFLRAVEPHRWGAEIFSLGLWIALPMVAMLLFTNLVLGVISRVAQQMNIFAIGFPITLGVGLIGVHADPADDAGAVHHGAGEDAGALPVSDIGARRNRLAGRRGVRPGVAGRARS